MTQNIYVRMIRPNRTQRPVRKGVDHPSRILNIDVLEEGERRSLPAAMESKDELFNRICTGHGKVSAETLESVLLLAAELAREGREGTKVGTLFVVGDSEEVLMRSKPMILDPLLGHPADKKHIDDPELRETCKELSLLDGAFVVSDDGIVLSACRYIDTSSEGIVLPLGLGSRHMAAASITKHTRAVSVVVSRSTVVRVFDKGKLMAEITPEVWIMQEREDRGQEGGLIRSIKWFPE